MYADEFNNVDTDSFAVLTPNTARRDHGKDARVGVPIAAYAVLTAALIAATPTAPSLDSRFGALTSTTATTTTADPWCEKYRTDPYISSCVDWSRVTLKSDTRFITDEQAKAEQRRCGYRAGMTQAELAPVRACLWKTGHWKKA